MVARGFNPGRQQAATILSMESPKPHHETADDVDTVASESVELDWHDVSLIKAMLKLSPLERLERGEEMAKEAKALRDAVRHQI